MSAKPLVLVEVTCASCLLFLASVLPGAAVRCPRCGRWVQAQAAVGEEKKGQGR